MQLYGKHTALVQQACSFNLLDKQSLTHNEGNKVELREVTNAVCSDAMKTWQQGFMALNEEGTGWTFFSSAQHLPNVG
jgi:hypothetical protein